MEPAPPAADAAAAADGQRQLSLITCTRTKITTAAQIKIALYRHRTNAWWEPIATTFMAKAVWV